MTKLYSINLTGPGDHELALVTKDVFDWINSPRPEKFVEHSAKDIVPESVEQKLKAIFKEEFGEEYDGIEVSSGSCENDRALVAIRLGETFEGKQAHFWSAKEQRDFCKKHKIEIVDDYDGGIY